MSKTLLDLIKAFSARRGLPLPTIVAGSQDDQLLQLIGLLNEVLEDLTTRYVGTALQKSATWLQTGVESQGFLGELCPYGFKWVTNGTFWDGSQQLPVRGPIDAQEWQDLKNRAGTGAWLQYRIAGGELLLIGSLATGRMMSLEYASDWAVKAADGTWKAEFSADTDTCVFPSAVLQAGLNWKWRLEKGLRYSEAFRTYETLVSEFNGHDGTKAVLNMAEGCGEARPLIFMPSMVGPR